MKTKTLVISTITLGTLALAGLYGIGTLNAQESNDYPPIIQKLAEKFNLNPDEIKTVFDENKEERHQEIQARFEENLTKVVEEGEITTEQKETILAKKAEMQEKHKELKDLSPEERKDTMKEFKEEMRVWAEENDIDLKQFFGPKPGGSRKGHFGPKFGR